MATVPFGDRLAEAVVRVGAPTCLGIDPHLERLPAPLVESLGAGGGRDGGRPGVPEDRRRLAEAVRRFGLGVVEVAAGRVAAVKPQVAFFEALGAPGVAALEDVVAAARRAGLIVVLDAKRGDIGSTAEAYARAVLDEGAPLASDALTVSPYLGPESLAPFVRRTAESGRGIFVLVRTSNPGAEVWQGSGPESGVAGRVAAWVEARAAEGRARSGLGNVGAVVGATVPAEADAWRSAMPHAWFLVPGYGAQGGRPEHLGSLLRPDGLGALVVSARAVLFPDRGREDDWQAGIDLRLRRFHEDLRGLRG